MAKSKSKSSSKKSALAPKGSKKKPSSKMKSASARVSASKTIAKGKTAKAPAQVSAKVLKKSGSKVASAKSTKSNGSTVSAKKSLAPQTKIPQTKIQQTKIQQTKIQQTKIQQTKIQQTSLVSKLVGKVKAILPVSKPISKPVAASAAVEISSRKDLKKAAQVADAMTKKKRGGRGPKAPPSIYTQSLSTLNRASGSTAPVSLSQHSENVCREVACDQLGSASGYCRVHYIKNWSQIKRKEVILKERKLDTFIEEIVTKYPEKYVEAIKSDLFNERSFAKVVSDLELDGGPADDADAATDMDSDNDSEPVIDTVRAGFETDSEGF